MKTAVSVPDNVFAAAERLAEELGVSRSHLYTRALAELLEQHYLGQVTERLDAIYDGKAAAVDPILSELQLASLGEEEW